MTDQTPEPLSFPGGFDAQHDGPSGFEPEEGEPILIQLDGSYVDGVYTALARIPGPEEGAAPLAEIKLTFADSIADGAEVGAMIQTFLMNVDTTLERIDEIRMLDQEATHG